MKLRTRFLLSTIAFGTILLVIAASVIYANRRLDETSRQEQLARSVMQESNELSYLSTAFVLYGQSQQLSRWEEADAALVDYLARLTAETPQQQSSVANLKSYQGRLRAIFNEVRPQLEAAYQNGKGIDPTFVRVTWSRMEVQNQAMISEASTMAQLLRAQQDWFRGIVSLLVVALIVAFGAFLLSNYLLAYRQTIGGIAELQSAAEIIGSGNLDHPIPEKGTDEISELCRAFNRMAVNLKEVMASKVELEREIAGRTRAEAERERLLQAEQEARTLAESAVKIRDEFISVAAHELKTPVTAMQGFSQIMLRDLGKNGEVDHRRLARAMERIEQQSKRLTKLTDQLLSLSRLQSGKLVLAKEETNLSHLARRIVADFGDANQGRQIQFRDEGVDSAFIDPLRIEQVMVNLLDNATKFSPPDSAIDLEIGSTEPGWIEIRVRDRGIGISSEKQPYIFERFYQAQPGMNSGGMGIGLYVCQEIVQMHGGTIAVEQPDGGGSRFVVWLPATPSASSLI